MDEDVKSVLVVDDEPDVVTYLCTLLQEHGVISHSAGDAASGIASARELHPDLICLDILMPDKSGILLYEELKADPLLRGIPVVIVTGFRMKDRPMVEFMALLEQKGLPPPEGYLEKPMNRDVFLRLIQDILVGGQSSAPENRTDKGGRTMEGKKIMVIDDEADVVTFLTTLLEENGYCTCSACDGVEGLDKIRVERPDLICLDLLMPEKTGILLYREIRKDDQLREIPVIMITGFAAPEFPLIDFKRFITKRSIPPPEFFMEKPIDRQALLNAIRETLGTRSKGAP
jgi:CheY-like chemotaxis protein